MGHYTFFSGPFNTKTVHQKLQSFGIFLLNSDIDKNILTGRVITQRILQSLLPNFGSKASIFDNAHKILPIKHQFLTLTHLFLLESHQFLTPVEIMTIVQGI